jgi:predicted  nucleic acid-binding Zn-ribbon protein
MDFNIQGPAQDSKKGPAAVVPEGVTNDFHEIMRRLRLIEERYSGLRKKTQFTEQTMLKDVKDLSIDIRDLGEAMSELRNEISELTEKMAKLTEEIKNAVEKSEFNVLVKYMDYWEPMNFLTKKDAEKMISELRGKV